MTAKGSSGHCLVQDVICIRGTALTPTIPHPAVSLSTLLPCWGFGEVPRSSMAHPQVLVHSCQAHLVETETFLRRYSCHDCNGFYQLRRLRARDLDVETVANLYATPVTGQPEDYLRSMYSGDED